jgi:hypothetical protein
MHRITRPIRVRALEGTVRILGRVLAACARALHAAGVSPPDVDVMFQGGITVEHTDTLTERALVLQVLDRPGSRSRAELDVVLSDVEPLAVSDALTALEAEGVIFTCGELAWASQCVRHLDKLGFISV